MGIVWETLTLYTMRIYLVTLYAMYEKTHGTQHAPTLW